jgi:hypothetical protein
VPLEGRKGKVKVAPDKQADGAEVRVPDRSLGKIEAPPIHGNPFPGGVAVRVMLNEGNHRFQESSAENNTVGIKEKDEM